MKFIPNTRLRTARLQHHWSQQELADQVGTTPATVSRWERGVTTPSPYFRTRLGNVFHVAEVALGFPPDRSAIVETVPHLWYAPYQRNPYFTGRDRLLQEIASYWQTDDRFPALALCGLGGMGKTQIANEYSHRFRDHYRHILWFHAESWDTLLVDATNIASMIGLLETQRQNSDQLIANIRHWLSQQQDWLLILDNVENLDLAHHILPLTMTGHILITTRLHMMGTLASALPTAPFSHEEGMLFLVRRTHAQHSRHALTTAREIVDLLDRVPLALDQAGAYIEETGCSLAEFQHLYQHHQPHVLARRGMGTFEHPLSFTATLSLTFVRLRQTHASAWTLLVLLSLLAPDAIPLEMLRQGSHALHAELAAVVADPLEFDSALAALCASSLVTRQEQTLSMHRLVQVIVQTELERHARQNAITDFVQLMLVVFPDASDVTTWAECRRLLPHALRAIDRIVAERSFGVGRFRLVLSVSQYLFYAGHYAQAQALIQAVLPALRATETSLELAEGLDLLASLAREQQQFAQAEVYIQQSLMLRQQTLGAAHPTVAECLHDLANVYRLQERFEEAETLYRQSLTIIQQALGEHHWKVAVCYNDLGMIAYAQGCYARSIALYEQALQIYRQALGQAHPYWGITLYNIGKIYRDQGYVDKAEAHFRCAITLIEQAYGETHPHVVRIQTTLATMTFPAHPDGHPCQSDAEHTKSAAQNDQGNDHG